MSRRDGSQNHYYPRGRNNDSRSRSTSHHYQSPRANSGPQQNFWQDNYNHSNTGPHFNYQNSGSLSNTPWNNPPTQGHHYPYNQSRAGSFNQQQASRWSNNPQQSFQQPYDSRSPPGPIPMPTQGTQQSPLTVPNKSFESFPSNFWANSPQSAWQNITKTSSVPSIPTDSAVNPPLGSKEAREKRLEESRDRLVKSLQESKNDKTNSINKLEESINTKSNPSVSSSDEYKLSTEKSKTKDLGTSNKPSDRSSGSTNQNQQRRLSFESSSQVGSVDTCKVSKSTTASSAASKRTRSTSLSSSSGKKSDHPSPARIKGPSDKQTVNIKQRVIQQLLSMSQNKLREIVSNPRSRKFEFVMKYMMKERRSQQSQKERLIAQAGITGTLTDHPSGDLGQLDYETLLSDPDLAVNLSNLPPEMIETLGNIFNLNSTDVNDPTDVNSSDEVTIIGDGPDFSSSRPTTECPTITLDDDPINSVSEKHTLPQTKANIMETAFGPDSVTTSAKMMIPVEMESILSELNTSRIESTVLDSSEVAKLTSTEDALVIARSDTEVAKLTSTEDALVIARPDTEVASCTEDALVIAGSDTEVALCTEDALVIARSDTEVASCTEDALVIARSDTEVASCTEDALVIARSDTEVASCTEDALVIARSDTEVASCTEDAVIIARPNTEVVLAQTDITAVRCESSETIEDSFLIGSTATASPEDTNYIAELDSFQMPDDFSTGETFISGVIKDMSDVIDSVDPSKHNNDMTGLQETDNFPQIGGELSSENTQIQDKPIDSSMVEQELMATESVNENVPSPGVKLDLVPMCIFHDPSDLIHTADEECVSNDTPIDQGFTGTTIINTMLLDSDLVVSIDETNQTDKLPTNEDSSNLLDKIELPPFKVKSEKDESPNEETISLCARMVGDGVNEVSTQTELAPTSKSDDLRTVLEQIESLCQDSSILPAINELKRFLNTNPLPANDNIPQSTSGRRQCNAHNSRPTNVNKPQTSASIEKISKQSRIQIADSASDKITELINLDAEKASEIFENLDSHVKIEDIFRQITDIENKIETWMEIKKVLYEKMRCIIKNEKSNPVSLSEEQSEANDSHIHEKKVGSFPKGPRAASKARPKPVPKLSANLPKHDAPTSRSASRPSISTSKPASISTSKPSSISTNKPSSVSINKPSSVSTNKSSLSMSKPSSRSTSRPSSKTSSKNTSQVKEPAKKSASPVRSSQLSKRTSSKSTIDNSVVASVLDRSSKKAEKLAIVIEKEMPTTTSKVNKSRSYGPKSKRRKPSQSVDDHDSSVSTVSTDDSPNLGRKTRRSEGNKDKTDISQLKFESPPRKTKAELKEIAFETSTSDDRLGSQTTDSISTSSPRRRATRQSESVEDLICLEETRRPKRKLDSVVTDISPQIVLRSCSVVLEKCNDILLTKKRKLDDEEVENVIEEDSNRKEANPITETSESCTVDSSGDEDCLPLLKIIVPLKNLPISTLSKEDTDQNSMSSCDTTIQDLRTEEQDIETTLNSILKTKKSKVKKSKKRVDESGEPLEHHSSKHELLAFADHRRGVILDVKVVGRHVLAASEDGLVFSYSVKSGKLKKKYEGHTAAVTCMCVIESELEPSVPEKLVTGSLDEELRCYVMKTAELIHTPIRVGAAISIDQSWGTIYVGTKLGEVVKIDSKTFTIIDDHMKCSPRAILALKATKEGPRKVLIIGTRDQKIGVRDAETGLILRDVSMTVQTVYSLLLHKSLVYCGTMSGSIPVFDFTCGEEKFRFTAGVGVRCIKIYNGLLFAGCYDGFIYIFRISDQTLVTKVTGSGKMILCLDICKNKIIFSCKDTFQALNFPPEVTKVLKEAKTK